MLITMYSVIYGMWCICNILLQPTRCKIVQKTTLLTAGHPIYYIMVHTKIISYLPYPIFGTFI